MCSTFTGFLFGLTRNDAPEVGMAGSDADAAAKVMSKENAAKIESLKAEIHVLEKRLSKERENYQEMIASYSSHKGMDKTNWSALPYFAVDDSMVLHDGNYD